MEKRKRSGQFIDESDIPKINAYLVIGETVQKVAERYGYGRHTAFRNRIKELGYVFQRGYSQIVKER